MQWKQLGVVTFILTMLTSCQLEDNIVNLYTDRHYEVDQLLFDAFEEETGIQVNVVKLDADPLLTRLETEGNATHADLIFLADAGRLGRAKAKGLLTAFPDASFLDIVPAYLKDDDNMWIGLTKRARIFVYHPDRFSPSIISSYQSLAEESWLGKVAVRSSSHVYNQSLVAAMIETIGGEATSLWLEGLVDHFAVRDPLSGSTNPIGNDRDQAKAVFNGIADVAIMNSYYFGRMAYSEDPSEVEVASALSVFFPNQNVGGTHINISGAGLTRYGKRQEQALALIEYLLTPSAQEIFANANFEYPIRTDVQPHPLLSSWGSFEEMTMPLSALYTHSQEAYQRMVAAGWR